MATFTHVVEFDEAELVCRMIEAFFQKTRPAFATAADVMEHMDPALRDDWVRVAIAVHGYWNEAMAKAQPIQ